MFFDVCVKHSASNNQVDLSYLHNETINDNNVNTNIIEKLCFHACVHVQRKPKSK